MLYCKLQDEINPSLPQLLLAMVLITVREIKGGEMAIAISLSV